MTKFTDFVKSIMKRDGLSYREALPVASKEYKKNDITEKIGNVTKEWITYMRSLQQKKSIN